MVFSRCTTILENHPLRMIDNVINHRHDKFDVKVLTGYLPYAKSIELIYHEGSLQEHFIAPTYTLNTLSYVGLTLGLFYMRYYFYSHYF